MPLSLPRRLASGLLILVLLAGPAAAQNAGFSLNRYEPTPAGSWMYAVETPWYSATRYFAGGLTLNYARNPLVYGTRFPDGTLGPGQAVVAHQLVTHVDLAGSFLNRVLLHLSLPITLLERGSSIGGLAPLDGVGVGDLRFGATARLYGEADRDKLSIHVGATLWIPLNQASTHQGDATVRFLPRIILSGLLRRHARYTVNAGFLVRPEAQLSLTGVTVGTATVGHELQIGLAAGYTDTAQTFYVGPELLIASQVAGGDPFGPGTTSIELLAGGNYLVKNQVMVGAALGMGFLAQPGTPDLRFLLRAAYSPVRDSDKDGVADRDDACPKAAGVRTGDPKTHGCPVDRDGDGVTDAADLCPDAHKGDTPDPSRAGCPLNDEDLDGVPNEKDLCPTVAKGSVPDPGRLGCPRDSDGDTILDAEDVCVEVARGSIPDPERNGCPRDRDRDLVIDEEDVCPDIHKGETPDDRRRGCPAPPADRDRDTVADAVDACPDQPGAPDRDPKKNGCPGKVAIKGGKLVIIEPVYFATNKDIILPRSYPVLQSVAEALAASPAIKRVAVEGHTDSRGSPKKNITLSDRRAKSVMRFLIGKGIEKERLEARGFGPLRPLVPNKTDQQRAINRRVEFRIIDPTTAGGADPTQKARPAATPRAAAAATSKVGTAGKGKLSKGKRRKPIGKGKAKVPGKAKRR